jgi:hypothetical protein
MKKILSSPRLADKVTSWSLNIAITISVLLMLACLRDTEITEGQFFFSLLSAAAVVLFGQALSYFLVRYYKNYEEKIRIRTFVCPLLFSVTDVGKMFIVLEIERDKVLVCEVIEDTNVYDVKHLIQVSCKKWYDLRTYSIAAYSLNHVFTVFAVENNFPYTKLVDTKSHIFL